MESLSFHPTLHHPSLLGFFASPRLRLDVTRLSPFTALHRQSHISFLIDLPSARSNSTVIPLSLLSDLYQSCCGVFAPGLKLRLRIVLKGGGACFSPSRNAGNRIPTRVNLTQQQHSRLRAKLPADFEDSDLSFDLPLVIEGSVTPLSRWIEQYAVDGARTVLLVGDSCSGKTHCCKRLAIALLEHLRVAVPIYVDLSEFEDVTLALQQYEADLSAVESSKLLFIFDGYDGVRHSGNLIEESGVIERYPGASVIVAINTALTSTPRYKNRFTRKGMSVIRCVVEARIASVTEKTLSEAIANVKDEAVIAAGWGSKEEFAACVARWRLDNPFQIRLCYKIANRVKGMDTVNIANVICETVYEKVKATLGSQAVDMITLCIDSAFGNHPDLRFEHIPPPSLLFCISESHQVVFPVSQVRYALLAAGLVQDVLTRTFDHYFNRLLLIHEPQVFAFFRDLAPPALEPIRSFLIEQTIWSRGKPSPCTAGANAISLANACRIPLSNCDFSGTILKDADVSGACFRRVNFEKTDFERAAVDQTVFIDCAVSQQELNSASVKKRNSLQITIEPRCIAVSPDETCIALDQGNRILMVDTENLEGMYYLEGHTEQISALSFTSMSTTLVSLSRDRTVRWWRHGLSITAIGLQDRIANDLAIEKSEDIVAVAGVAIELWSEGQPYRVPRLQCEVETVRVAFATAKQGCLASAHTDMTIRVWKIEEEKAPKPVQIGKQIQRISVMNDDVLVATDTEVFRLRLDTESPQPVICNAEWTHCWFDSNFELIAVAGGARPGCVVFDLGTGKEALAIPLKGPIITFFSEGLFIADKNALYKVEFASNFIAAPILRQVRDISLTAQGEVAIAHASGYISIWNVETRNCIETVLLKAVRVWLGLKTVCVITEDDQWLEYKRGDYRKPIQTVKDVRNYYRSLEGQVFSFVSGQALVSNRSLPAISSHSHRFTSMRLVSSTLFAVRENGEVIAWNSAFGEIKQIARVLAQFPSCFATEKPLLAIVTEANTVAVIDFQQEHFIATAQFDVKTDSEMKFYADEVLLIANCAQMLYVCEAESLRVVTTIDMLGVRNLTVAGKYMAFGQEAVEVYDLSAVGEENRGEGKMVCVWSKGFADTYAVIKR